MNGVDRSRRAGRHFELTQNIADVTVDRSLTQAQLTGNLFVGMTARNQAQHLELARRQGMSWGGLAKHVRSIHTNQFRLRSEPFELGPRRLVLEPCGLIIAKGAAGLPDEHAHARRLIRCLEALPVFKRASKGVERRVRMAFDKGDCAIGLRHHRAKIVGVEYICQFLEFIAGGPGVLDIADRQHDLEVGRQESGASQPIARRARQPADRRARGVGASLRQSQERESWLRFASQFARGMIGVLRLRKLAAEAVDLGLLIEGRAGWLSRRALGALTGTAGFGQRVRPRPLQLQDLGPMHEAGAGKRAHIRLLLTDT
jgi:hypothetical protein